MTLEQALKTKLLADAGLTALIGSRLYPDNAIPQNVTTRPALTYRHAGSDPTHYLTGGRSELERDTFEITAHSPNLSDCAAVRDYLRAMLSGTAARGVWGGAGGVTVRACLWQDVYQEDQNPADASEVRPRAVRGNLTILWQR